MASSPAGAASVSCAPHSPTKPTAVSTAPSSTGSSRSSSASWERDQLVRDELVDEVREEARKRVGGGALARGVRAQQPRGEAPERELAHLGHLRVDDGEERSVDGGVGGRGDGGGKQLVGEEAAAALEVEAEQLDDGGAYVLGVGLVDGAAYVAFELAPGDLLWLRRVDVCLFVCGCVWAVRCCRCALCVLCVCLLLLLLLLV